MRVRKVDANQRAIVAALRKAGCRVAMTHTLSDGFPDLLVGRRGGVRHDRDLVLLEVKDGDKSPSARKLTQEEEIFHDLWQGWPIFVVNSVAEALAVCT